MGFACPVCSTPQADRRHLADHVAITAMVHGDDHETWLDEHVEDWSSMGPEELGPVLAEHAVETEYEAVFEDTTGGSTPDHDHGPDRDHDHRGVSGDRLEDAIARQGRRGPDAGGRGRSDLTAEQRAIVEEAREMTHEMIGEETDPDDPRDDRSDTSDGDRRVHGSESESASKSESESASEDGDDDEAASTGTDADR